MTDRDVLVAVLEEIAGGGAPQLADQIMALGFRRPNEVLSIEAGDVVIRDPDGSELRVPWRGAAGG